MGFELSFVATLLIILLAVGGGRLLSKIINQPRVLGDLILGAILGSFIAFSVPGAIAHDPLFNILKITDSEILFAVSDIGIILLLFRTGLGIDIENFRKYEWSSILIALSGVVVPFVFGFFSTTLFLPADTPHLNLVGFFVGLALVATSVGVSAELLTELNLLRSRMGTLIIGSAVVDDVIGVFLMTSFAGIAVEGGSAWGDLVLVIPATAIFFILSLTVGVKGFKKLSEKISFGRDDLLLFGLIIVVSFWFIAEKIELSAIIGAFIAGLLLGQSRYSPDLQEHISLFGESFFIPIFFVSIGMQFDLRALGSVGVLSIVLVFVAVLGKIFGCGLATKALRFSNRESLAVGVAMVPRAGVELVLIKIGLQSGVIGPDIASAILLIVMFTCLSTPPILRKIIKGG